MSEAVESDVRITPPTVWGIVRTFAGSRRVCDVCTQPDNPLGADRFFTEADDAIYCRWLLKTADLPYWTFWNNPPYSRGQVIRFAKCTVGWARLGLEILMLTQADVSTDWYAYLAANADARVHLNRRVGFLSPDGAGGYVPSSGAKFGSAVWYFGQRRQRFARVFGAHGEHFAGLGPAEETT